MTVLLCTSHQARPVCMTYCCLLSCLQLATAAGGRSTLKPGPSGRSTALHGRGSSRQQRQQRRRQCPAGRRPASLWTVAAAGLLGQQHQRLPPLRRRVLLRSQLAGRRQDPAAPSWAAASVQAPAALAPAPAANRSAGPASGASSSLCAPPVAAPCPSCACSRCAAAATGRAIATASARLRTGRRTRASAAAVLVGAAGRRWGEKQQLPRGRAGPCSRAGEHGRPVHRAAACSRGRS